jgi:hypothetical protein
MGSGRTFHHKKSLRVQITEVRWTYLSPENREESNMGCRGDLIGGRHQSRPYLVRFASAFGYLCLDEAKDVAINGLVCSTSRSFNLSGLVA